MKLTLPQISFTLTDISQVTVENVITINTIVPCTRNALPTSRLNNFASNISKFLLTILQEIHCGLRCWLELEVVGGRTCPWRRRHVVLAHGEGGAHHEQHNIQPILRLHLLQGE